LPDPGGGLHGALTLSYACSNWRKRPTVTRYLSSEKLLTVAWSAVPARLVPLLSYVR
jgi:hypothetical protein